jgi:hypothetical protein
MRTDGGRKDKTMLILAFRYFANATKHEGHQDYVIAYYNKLSLMYMSIYGLTQLCLRCLYYNVPFVL